MLCIGRSYLTVYRSDYTRNKFVLDQNNLLKICYAHWCATTNPNYISFIENLSRMLISGDYVLSAKLLVANSMDEPRTESCWKVMLKPEICNKYLTRQIFYGSVVVEEKDTVIPRYTLNQFKIEGNEKLEKLQHDIMIRRKNTVIVSPPACGKTNYCYLK